MVAVRVQSLEVEALPETRGYPREFKAAVNSVWFHCRSEFMGNLLWFMKQESRPAVGGARAYASGAHRRQ